MTNNLNMKIIILSIILIIIIFLIIYINYNKYIIESFFESGMSSSDNNNLLTVLQNTIDEFPNRFKNIANTLFNQKHTNDNHSHLNNIYIKKENSSKHIHPQYTNPNLNNYLTISKFNQDSEDLSALIKTNETNIDTNKRDIDNIDINSINTDITDINTRLSKIEERLGSGQNKKYFPLYRGNTIYGKSRRNENGYGYNIKI